jgi:hypothetical protein
VLLCSFPFLFWTCEIDLFHICFVLVNYTECVQYSVNYQTPPPSVAHLLSANWTTSDFSLLIPPTNHGTFNMDMSYVRMVLTVRCKIWRCKMWDLTPAHPITLIVTNDVTWPLLCARITCYVNSYNTRPLLCACITCYVTVCVEQ